MLVETSKSLLPVPFPCFGQPQSPFADNIAQIGVKTPLKAAACALPHPFAPL